jgi:hypothetical protein
MTTWRLSNTPLEAFSVLWAEKNHSNCHEMFRDSVTGVKQHLVISLGSRSSMGNNPSLYLEFRASKTYLID